VGNGKEKLLDGGGAGDRKESSQAWMNREQASKVLGGISKTQQRIEKERANRNIRPSGKKMIQVSERRKDEGSEGANVQTIRVFVNLEVDVWWGLGRVATMSRLLLRGNSLIGVKKG